MDVNEKNYFTLETFLYKVLIWHGIILQEKKIINHYLKNNQGSLRICGEQKIIKCKMAMCFSEFEYENTNCCRDATA